MGRKSKDMIVSKKRANGSKSTLRTKKVQFSDGGAGYCLSRGLGEAMKPYAAGKLTDRANFYYDSWVFLQDDSNDLFPTTLWTLEFQIEGTARKN